MTKVLKVKDLNLSDETIKLMAEKLGWSAEDVYECDDFHIEESELSMLNWIYDDKYSASTLLETLDSTPVSDPNVSLLENLLLDHENIFPIQEGYLFFYV